MFELEIGVIVVIISLLTIWLKFRPRKRCEVCGGTELIEETIVGGELKNICHICYDGMSLAEERE